MKLLPMPSQSQYSGGLLRWQARIYAGGTPSREESSYWDDGDVPWLASGDVNKRRITASEQYITKEGLAHSSAKWIPAKSVLIALAGQGKTKGTVATLEFLTTCNQSLAAIVPRPHLEYRFLAYYLESRYADIRALVGEMRDGLNLEIIGSIEVPMPPREESNHIADFLDQQVAKIDALMLKKRELIDQLDEKLTALISITTTNGLDPTGKLKPSGDEWLGDVPEHWDVMAVRRRARRIQTGSTPPTAKEHYYEDGSVPWYGPSSFKGQIVASKPVKMLNVIAVSDGVARLFAAEATMVVTIGATAGKVSALPDPGSCNQQITVIEFDPKHIHPRFITYQLKRLETTLRAIAPCATLPILNQGDIADIKLALPPLPEQHAIAAFLDRETAKIDALVAKVEAAVEQLQEYRTALIAAAVTGGVKIPSI